MNDSNDLVNQINNSPAHFFKLREIVNFKNGKGHEQSISPFGEYIVVNSKYISTNGDVVKYSKTQICPIYKNDILMVMSDLPNGRALAKCFIVDKNNRYTLNQRIACFTNKRLDILNNKFLYYILNRNKQLLNYDNGVDQTNLRKDDILNIIIPVPPLPIQEEIVRVLDNFTELTAELTAELTTELQDRKKQYEYYRDSLLTFNNEYKKCKLIDILSQPITDGPHVTPNFVESGIPFLSAEAISDGRIHFDKIRGYITEEFDLECCKKYKPQKGDVYLVKSGSTTGKVGYVDTDIRFNIWSPLAAMRVNDENSSKYLYYLLQTKSIQEQVQSKASNGSQPNLSMRTLEQFDIAVPSLEIQERIVNVLDNFEKICNDLKIGLPAEIELRQKQYEYYKDKLLTFKRR